MVECCRRAAGIEFQRRGAVTANDLDLRAVRCRRQIRDLALGEGPVVRRSAKYAGDPELIINNAIRFSPFSKNPYSSKTMRLLFKKKILGYVLS